MMKTGHEKDKIQKLADKVSEKAWKEDYPIEMERTLHLVKQHDLVGAMIKKAMAEGEFDNLEGTGKPLDLGDTPFAADELHMAYKILKDNGYAPYWIELGKEIKTLWEKLNQEVESFKKYTRMVYSQKRSNGALHRYDQKKKAFYSQSQEHLKEISKRILDYNIYCPVSWLGRGNFQIDDEMNRIINEIETLTSGSSPLTSQPAISRKHP